MERDDWKKYQNDFSGGQQFSPEQQYGGTPLQPSQTEQYQQPRQPVIIVGEPERDKKEKIMHKKIKTGKFSTELSGFVMY